MSYYDSFRKGIAVIDYLLEDNCNTLKQASEEFRVSQGTLRHWMDIVRDEAFYNTRCPNCKQLRAKYLRAKMQLKRNSINVIS